MKRLAIGVVALAGMLALAGAWWWTDRQEAHSSPGDEISVVGPEAELLGRSFDVHVDISEADSSYAGYQAYLVWDDSVVNDDTGVTYTGLGGMALDATPVAIDGDTDTVTDGYQFGSAKAAGTATNTGTAAIVGLKCVGVGVSPLHLVTLVQDPAFGTTLLGIGVISPPTNLVDGSITCVEEADTDADGCMSSEELSGAPAPKPGATGAYDPLAWYDFYDVPAPVNADPTANGSRNGAVNMSDVLAVLQYVGTKEGGQPNPNGVAYDSVKGSCDWNADTTPDKEGLCYDRSSGALPNPPWAAGPPDGAISMQDIMVVLPQMGLDCSGPP